jgi:hypothetical protein
MTRANGHRQPLAVQPASKGATKVPLVRRSVRTAAAATSATVPPAPAAARSRKATPKKSRVAPPAAAAESSVRRDGAAALALITEPLRRGDGFRHLWLGDTGTGKTVAMRALVDHPGQLVLVHDDSKARPEYPQLRYFGTPGELLALPADEVEHLHAAAFRGDVFAGVACEVEDVAALALQAARARIPCRLVVDEWERAMSDGGRKLEAASLRTCLTTGRSMALSVAGGAQIPQRVGDVVINSASSVGLFRLGPAGLNYLDERLYFDRRMLEVIPRLQVGDFVLHRPGHPWDGVVYRF